MEVLKKNVVLAPYTTYKVGGPARYFIEVTSAEELVVVVLNARKGKTPNFLLGAGANILIGDKGFNGLVIANKANNFYFKDTTLISESGAHVSQLIEESKNRGLSGLEHFVGIPSTVGGAIWQNLHFLAPDRKNTLFISEIVKEARILCEDGTIKNFTREDLAFGYDESILHHRDLVVLSVEFELAAKKKEEIEKQMKENLKWRNEKQPQLEEFPSCGSVFKKIEGVGAGRLIEESGLKGKRIGNAEVSEKHANYIVNRGGATASDVRGLIELIQNEVFEKTGYKLEPEIGFVGEF